MSRRKRKARLVKTVCKLCEPPFTEAYVMLPESLVNDAINGTADGFDPQTGMANVADILTDAEMVAAGFNRYAKFRIVARVGYAT